MSVCALAAASCTKEASFTEETKPEAKTEMGAGEVRDGWIRIKIKEDAAPLRAGVFTRGAMESGNEDMDRIAAELGATEVRRVFSDGGRFAERRRRYGLHLWYDVRFDESVPVSRAADRFATIDGVEYIEPVYVIKSTDADAVYVPDNVIYTPSVAVTRTEMPFNDPMLSQQWHYNNEGENGFTAGADINLFEAWKVETGKPNVIVSVHDQGIVLDHEDLAAHIWVNEAEMNGAEGVDDDGNGYKDDIHGWNYINNSPDIIPEGHGTHVAGTISAVNNNGIGVCGVAGGTGEEDGVRIMSLQILYQPVAGGSSQFSERAPETYAYAADNGAVISQNSWTLGVTGKLPYSYEQAFTYFNENAGMDDTDGDGVNDVQTGPMAGGIIIFAAGNAGGPTLLPAASDKVIAVAASGPNYEKGSYSSCGPEIDILAPGGAGSQGGKGNVLSTYKDSYTGEVGYSHLWGTSMACPHVSGVAALIVSHFGGEGFTAEECKKRLLNGYRPMGGLIPDDQLGDIGVGLLDAAAALMDDPGTAPANVDDAEVSSELNKINLTWTVPADGNGAAVATYWVTYGAEGEEPVEQEIRNLYNVGTEVTYALDGKYNTAYDISIQTEDRWGNRTTEAKELSVTLGTFENVAPTVMEKIGDSNIAAPGEENIRQYTLSDYFTDRNLSDGDVLAYTASSSNEAVVAVSVAEDILTLTPKAKGSANITVTATDLAGASAELKFRVSVTSGPAPGQAVSALPVTENPVGDALGFSLSEASGATVDVTVYDAAARKIYGGSVTLDTNGAGSVDAAAWSPGAYTLAVVHGNQTLNASFVKR